MESGQLTVLLRHGLFPVKKGWNKKGFHLFTVLFETTYW